jgi:prepilin-type N-terminal cleavage/methylation domain-containing protein
MTRVIRFDPGHAQEAGLFPCEGGSGRGCRRPRRRIVRRGFNFVEMLIALAITGALLAATMAALDASFTAYQSTTEESSTYTIARLMLMRMVGLIRTGQEFGPFPANPKDTIVQSSFIQIQTPDGDIIEIRFDEDDEALYVDRYDAGGLLIGSHRLLEGVIPQYTQDEQGNDVIMPPFTLEYDLGRILYRCSFNFTIQPDDNMSVELDGENVQEIELAGAVIPRTVAYDGSPGQ